MERRSWHFYIMLGLAWTVVAFLVLPLLVVVPVSFTDQRFLSFPQETISFKHYANLVADPFWRNSILRSLFVSTVSATFSTILGTMCAIGCWRLANQYAEWVRLLMLTPIIVPSVVHALAFYRTWIDLGLIDTYAGVILSHTIIGLPYVVITVSASLANIDLRLEQAARSLGADMSKTVRWVLVPLVMPGILSGAIFAFIISWDEIVVLLFITSRNIYLLPKAIWDGINENVDPTVAAVASLLIGVTLVILLVQMSWRGLRGAKR
ncbi:ABC transporter permease [Acuticoccus mangrovi]|uniref:ABC transporter permease n=1 Tax=Acuticoccus mangrovi TaxID=2796142 RepID=A0A934IIG4_9HYPH|nr:ABC transporter permease [Acuticoccus mangrovi]MBJ3774302.1 ABC transporter permease [Acuticoccus mangrovi]